MQKIYIFEASIFIPKYWRGTLWTVRGPACLEDAGLSLFVEACLIQQSGDQIENNPL